MMMTYVWKQSTRCCKTGNCFETTCHNTACISLEHKFVCRLVVISIPRVAGTVPVEIYLLYFYTDLVLWICGCTQGIGFTQKYVVIGLHI